MGAATVLFADDTAQGPFFFHLLNPVPTDQMRELSTDRPDQTESPYTVDAGHFQIESDIFSFSRDRDRGSPDGGIIEESGSFAALNLKAGLFRNLDLQVLLDPYLRRRTFNPSKGNWEQADGFGEVTVRIKLNLWGNDGVGTAFALMPYVKAPTASRGFGNGAVEGGVILPFALTLPSNFSLGLQTQGDIVRNDGFSGIHLDWCNSVTIGHSLVGDLAGYAEVFTVTHLESAGFFEAYFDLGLTYGLTGNIQLDAGCNFGITESAKDYNPFVGVTFRF